MENSKRRAHAVKLKFLRNSLLLCLFTGEFITSPPSLQSAVTGSSIFERLSALIQLLHVLFIVVGYELADLEDYEWQLKLH